MPLIQPQEGEIYYDYASRLDYHYIGGAWRPVPTLPTEFGTHRSTYCSYRTPSLRDINKLYSLLSGGKRPKKKKTPAERHRRNWRRWTPERAAAIRARMEANRDYAKAVNRAHKILCVETGQVFPSPRAAAVYYGLAPNKRPFGNPSKDPDAYKTPARNIALRARLWAAGTGSNHLYGFHWQYAPMDAPLDGGPYSWDELRYLNRALRELGLPEEPWVPGSKEESIAKHKAAAAATRAAKRERMLANAPYEDEDDEPTTEPTEPTEPTLDINEENITTP